MFVPLMIDFGKRIGKLDTCEKVLSKEEEEAYEQKYMHIVPEVVAGTHL